MGLEKDKKREQPAPPCLIFRNVPKDMTIQAMHNICSLHGRVTDVRDSKKNSFYFVDLATVADMEAVFRALEHNTYGFNVFMSQNKTKSDVNINKNNQRLTPVPTNNTGIDNESRRDRTSRKNHTRPNLRNDSLLNTGDAAATGLPLILKDDARSLERQGLNKLPNNNKFNNHNGRSNLNMQETSKQFIDKKNKESSGACNGSGNKYSRTSVKSPILNNNSKCSECYYDCDTVCERCSSKYYCSVECQLSDWPEHRYICGKPKHLQKTPPHKKQPHFENTKIPKENNIKSTESNFSKDQIQNGKRNIETNSSKQLPMTPKNVPKQLQKSPNDSSQQQKNFAKALPKQLQKPSTSSSQKTPSPPKISSQKLPETSKPPLQELSSSYSIASLQHLLNSAKSSSHQQKNFAKAIPKQLQKPSNSSSQQITTPPNVSPQQPLATTKAASHGDLEDISSHLKTSQNNPQSPPESNAENYKRNMPRSGNIVTITAISKTNVVFVRCNTYDANLSYFNTIDSLQAIRKILKPLKTLPKSGEMVIAKFEEQFNRALVLSAVNPSKVLIHFMDYGNMEFSSLQDLYETPEGFLYKPRHAIPVQLKDVSDVYMTEEIRKFMHSYLNNINVEIRYKPEDFNREKGIFAVELINENTQQNFNKMIMKLSKPEEPQNSNEICERGYLDQKILPAGNNVEYIVMDNSLMSSGCISCTIKPYLIEIDKFKKEIQAYVKSIPNEAYSPRVQELCIARYSEDGLWYRGLCLEAVGDGHPSIHFIDYGNITIVPIEDIRRYPRQFTYPIYTVDCAIEGLPEACDEKLLAKLEELIPSGEIIECDHVTFDEDNHFYFLSLSNVIKELTKCGLI